MLQCLCNRNHNVFLHITSFPLEFTQKTPFNAETKKKNISKRNSLTMNSHTNFFTFLFISFKSKTTILNQKH